MGVNSYTNRHLCKNASEPVLVNKNDKGNSLEINKLFKLFRYLSQLWSPLQQFELKSGLIWPDMDQNCSTLTVFLKGYFKTKFP